MSRHEGSKSYNEPSQGIWTQGGSEDELLHEQIDAYYARGMSDNQVARAVGVCQRTVLRHRQKRGLRPNRPTGREY